MSLPKVLTISNSDCKGASGTQSDIKTLTSLQVYATSVATSNISRKTGRIIDIPPEFVTEEIESVLSDIGSNAIKIGMLPSVAMIKEVAATLRKYPEQSHCVIVDCKMITAIKDDNSILDTFKKELLPLSFILTATALEAEILLNMDQNSIKSDNDMRTAAQKLSKLGAKSVLIDGSSLLPPLDKTAENPKAISIIYDSGSETTYEITSDYVNVCNVHGAKDILSAALSAEIAKGATVVKAAENAIYYLMTAVAQSMKEVDKHCKTVNYFHPLKWSPYYGKSLLDAIKDTLPDGLWNSYIDHPFVHRIADGTLPVDSFIFYLKQDYLYLQHYARVAALAAYKSTNMESIEANATLIMHIIKESESHLAFCSKWGITRKDIQNTPEHVNNSAYTRFVLDKGASGDILDLKMAMAPCAIGYGECARRLYNDPKTKREGNPFWYWIAQYGSEDYLAAEKETIRTLERLVAERASSVERFMDICKTFEQATRLEAMFFTMSLEGH